MVQKGVGVGQWRRLTQSCLRLQQEGQLERVIIWSIMRRVWELAAGAVAYLSTFGVGEGEENNDKIRIAWEVGD